MRVALLVLLFALPAHADDAWHGSIAGGGLIEATGPQIGAWGAVDLWPRGSVWGARGDALYLRSDESLLLVGSVARQLGATRPRLAVSLVAGAGADVLRPAFVVGGGLWAQLGLRLGPLALFGGFTGYLVAGDERFELLLTGSLGAGLGF